MVAVENILCGRVVGVMVLGAVETGLLDPVARPACWYVCFCRLSKEKR